jgi:ubiquitin carboxyl-terminal hydrolase 9/24
MNTHNARYFIENYAGSIVGILAEQQPSKIGPHERSCVQESLLLGVQIVADDLKIQTERKGECLLLERVLYHIFSRKKNFYKSKTGGWSNSSSHGPTSNSPNNPPPNASFQDLRLRLIDKFRLAQGFHHLVEYLQNTAYFPKFEIIHPILTALHDSLPDDYHTNSKSSVVEATPLHVNESIEIAQLVMKHMERLDDWKPINTETLAVVLKDLQRMFDKLVLFRRDQTVQFYNFYRNFLLSKLMTSPSLPLQLFGWEMLAELIAAVEAHRPPPRAYLVRDAGCTFANGEYGYGGKVTVDGYAVPGTDISYVRTVPSDADVDGKKLTIFRCTMRSQQKWWFLSEADEEQPGTDRDIDYYQHKSSSGTNTDEAVPPCENWIVSRNAGVHPPPTLQPVGWLVPPGQELETLEHQLAKWAIENEIVERVLGDTTIHREIVARSTVLIKFLASMCFRQNSTGALQPFLSDQEYRQQYCLQTSHLLFAWKTCLRKADAAVSLQVYQLLVSILPDCPSYLAIPLLQAIQTSLHESSEKRDHLFEVSEFCTAVAAANPLDNTSNNSNRGNANSNIATGSGTALSEDVREEVLNLLWSVLTHPGVSALKTYDSLKRYVTNELRVEPKGSEHRERFLQSCIAKLNVNAAQTQKIDELQALRIVKLTRFVLEACPRMQADAMVLANGAALPILLFKELVAYLERGHQSKPSTRVPLPVGTSRKPSLTNMAAMANVASDSKRLLADALDERLRILRFVYGLSSPNLPGSCNMEQVGAYMTVPMLEQLWKLCMNRPEDREALMVFIASASHPGKPALYDHFGAGLVTAGPTTLNASPGGGGGSSSSVHNDALLSPAFTDEVCHSVFLDLFCSKTFDYDQLGNNGYRSFQFLFKRLRSSISTTMSQKQKALDALWRVCLTAGVESVAVQAMKDLLFVYVDQHRHQQVQISATTQRMNIDDVTVKSDIQSVPSISDQMMIADENKEQSFGDRMFQVLERVKIDLEEGVPSADRSVERCMRILNEAIGCGVDNSAQGLTTTSALSRLHSLPPLDTNLVQAVNCLPFGMRGQASYRRIGILAKRHVNQIVSYENAPRLPSMSRFSLNVHPLETLASIKRKVAVFCQCEVMAVRPVQINGRVKTSATDLHTNLSVLPEDSVVDELGIVHGCEVVFVIADRLQNNATNSSTVERNCYRHDLSEVFFNDDGKFSDRLFSLLLSILEVLPWKASEEQMSDTENDTQAASDTHQLVWELLLAMPMNEGVASRVGSAQLRNTDNLSVTSSDDPMEVDSTGDVWSPLLDSKNFDRSVYVLLTIDAFLQPALEALSSLQPAKYTALEAQLIDDANRFRRAFIEAGGFNAVAKFFSSSGNDAITNQIKTRRGNAVALRILKACLFGDAGHSRDTVDSLSIAPDETGMQLLLSLSDSKGLLKSLTAMVVEDLGVSSSTITDILRFLRLLFLSPDAANEFVSLKDSEKFLVILLMWGDDTDIAKTSSSINAAMHVRKGVHDLILQTPILSYAALFWLINAVDQVKVSSDYTSEFFDVLEKLLSDAHSKSASDQKLQELGKIVCRKLASCPRPGNLSDLNEISTGVLCGCLRILRALIEHGSGSAIREGTSILISELQVERWSDVSRTASRNVFSMVTSPFTARDQADDAILVDLMGAIFDGFLSPGEQSPIAICCDKESRRGGFNVVSAAAKACKGIDGYMALVNRICVLVSTAVPKLRHRWGTFGGNTDSNSRNRAPSEYSGLRNQGCTCYMNSVLQQLFMMPEIRDSMCSAPLPASLRSVGSGVAAKGAELLGKKITLQWETGVSFDAVVESFDEKTEMHTIRYCPVQVAVHANGHQHLHAEDVTVLPPCFPDEFILSEGRPGKETGVFEIVQGMVDTKLANDIVSPEKSSVIKESEDESLSRHLLEEVQRTFIHLKEGSRGHCFDPRSLVEACGCLKLEFDVWQQNDASEFATKLLDRLEISLKKWAPSHFRHMDHTFGVKQTKQKICKKCGMKTNREEKLLNIDCQIRGKSDIHEALASMTEVEIMEGSNQVFCDNCKEKTDTILKSAISTLPNMLILSLKRFDLDYNTFETVKLNSRCAFGEMLNMKQYTLDAVEAMDKAEKMSEGTEPAQMETDESYTKAVADALEKLPDEDYEYRLVGVLVHAGVAQGGHYYSFIKDRFPGSEGKWHRFDDEDVTPFDPKSIETECFGGKVKKETKWPNGTVHTVEQEQFANALMLFYEKVKQSETPSNDSDQNCDNSSSAQLKTLSGYDVFEPDVRKSNAAHQWQSFLFDGELHYFLKGVLLHCEHEIKKPSEGGTSHSWRVPVLEMLLTFIFDVMIYSSDTSFINDWSPPLEEVLLNDSSIATKFIIELARKTKTVSGNWLRTCLLDCPDRTIRGWSVRIFAAAITTAIKSENEKSTLVSWMRAWREYVGELNATASAKGEKIHNIPCSLNGKWSIYEDPSRFGSEASSLGTIISALNLLLDAMPRSWRFSSDLCSFIRYLADCTGGGIENSMRRAMVDAQVAARLVALVARERTPSSFRAAFPGASASIDIASTQMRAETNPTSHVIPGQLLNSTENNSRGPNDSDYLSMFEAIASLAGIRGVQHAPLCREDDIVRGRQRLVLTEQVKACLTTMFQESCAPGTPGMGQREIELYLHRIDIGAVNTQKILDLLSKYPTTSGKDNDRNTYLSLEGFLAYYNDCVQNDELRLRMDLHTFGYRPDLSRRPRETRYFKIGDRETLCPPAQSVAEDVSRMFSDRKMTLGTFADFALTSTAPFYPLVQKVSEPMMEYLAAAVTYKRDYENLINRTLVQIYLTPTDWPCNAILHAYQALLRVISVTPGEEQQARVRLVMLSNVKPTRSVDFGAGLLNVLQTFYRMRQTHSLSNEVYWTFERYVILVKQLHKLYPVFTWMNDNKSRWKFVEREVTETRVSQQQQNQPLRINYGPREKEGSVRIDHQSDSDMGDMHDSDEDDDVQIDNLGVGQTPYPGIPTQIVVEGAGNPAVNGTYEPDGLFEGACRYAMEGKWNDHVQNFYVFLCNVSNNTKHWYISIVPQGQSPGTSSDIDFYSAPMTADTEHLPPLTGWVKAQEGQDPMPRFIFKFPADDLAGQVPVIEDDDALHDHQGSFVA